jgi:TatD DNase family protein
MRLLLDFGASVSFTGVVTFRNAKPTHDAARLAPLDRIMVETDAPFLTPEPYRTVRPNAPKYVVHVAEALAALRGEPVDRVREAVFANAQAFFGVHPTGA